MILLEFSSIIFIFIFSGEFFLFPGNGTNRKIYDLKGFFSPFFEINKIKLATSRPRHFLGRHL
jgi:hypothetical protein